MPQWGDEPGRLRYAERAALVGRAVSTAPAGKPSSLFRVRKEEVPVSRFKAMRPFVIPLALALLIVSCGGTGGAGGGGPGLMSFLILTGGEEVSTPRHRLPPRSCVSIRTPPHVDRPA